MDKQKRVMFCRKFSATARCLVIPRDFKGEFEEGKQYLITAEEVK